MWNISSAWARPGPSPATRCWSRPRPGPGPAPTHDMFYTCMHVESYIILDYLTLSYIIQCFAWGVSQYFFAWVTPYFFLLGTPYFFFREPPGDRTWAAPDFKFGGDVRPYLGGGMLLWCNSDPDLWHSQFVSPVGAVSPVSSGGSGEPDEPKNLRVAMNYMQQNITAGRYSPHEFPFGFNTNHLGVPLCNWNIW